MSEGLGWTNPKSILNQESDVTQIQVFPEYLPAGDKEDAVELTIGKSQKGPITLSIHRIILDKKVEKIVVQKTEFQTGKTFDNVLMVEIFAGKVAVFHDESNLLINAARVGKSDLIASILENKEIDVNGKNFRGRVVTF